MLKKDHYFVSPVEAVRVTKENMEEVAEWCGGKVQSSPNRKDPTRIDTYVLVPTPKGTRRTWAFPGMWITCRIAVTLENELKKTYAIFGRDYFDANYFETPAKAVDATWERAAREEAEASTNFRTLVSTSTELTREEELVEKLFVEPDTIKVQIDQQVQRLSEVPTEVLQNMANNINRRV